MPSIGTVTKTSNGSFRRTGHLDQVERARSGLSDMAKGLERDPQLESLLKNRRVELGLKPASGAGLSHDLAERLGLSRSIGISF